MNNTRRRRETIDRCDRELSLHVRRRDYWIKRNWIEENYPFSSLFGRRLCSPSLKRSYKGALVAAVMKIIHQRRNRDITFPLNYGQNQGLSVVVLVSNDATCESLKLCWLDWSVISVFWVKCVPPFVLHLWKHMSMIILVFKP